MVGLLVALMTKAMFGPESPDAELALCSHMRISQAGLCAAGCGRVMPTAWHLHRAAFGRVGGRSEGRGARLVSSRTQSPSFEATGAEWQAGVERAGKHACGLIPPPIPSFSAWLMIATRSGPEVEHSQDAAWICRPRRPASKLRRIPTMQYKCR